MIWLINHLYTALTTACIQHAKQAGDTDKNQVATYIGK